MRGRVELGDERYEIRLSGSGGQGIILASVILAEALALHEGRQVAQSLSCKPPSSVFTSHISLVT